MLGKDNESLNDSVTWEYGRSASMNGLEIIEKVAALAF